MLCSRTRTILDAGCRRKPIHDGRRFHPASSIRHLDKMSDTLRSPIPGGHHDSTMGEALGLNGFVRTEREYMYG